MSTGFIWGVYVSDDGNSYALRVDADYFAMPERGWTSTAPAGMPPYPRGWFPRKAVGLDPNGHPRKAVVATPVADLWTGVTREFHIRDSDGSLQTCTGIRLYGERWRARPA